MIMIICVSAGSILAYALYRYYAFVSRYPTGPFPLPFIGNLDKLDPRRIDQTFDKIGKAHPPIYTMFMPFPYVQITDYDVLREAFIEKGDAFAGRPQNLVIQEAFVFSPNTGVTMSVGDTWREQRRVAISILRDFGMGKNVMEELVRSSVSDFLEHVEQIVDKSNVDLYWPIQVLVANVINEVMFGYRYKHDDCKPLMDYVNRFNELMESTAENVGIALGMAFPSLAKLPWIGWHIMGRIKHEMHEINQYVVDNVTRCLDDYDVEDEPTCFAHAYKHRMEDNNNLDPVNLMSTCVDFFAAGQETSSTTLRWAMLILAAHPEIQEKLRDEILDVVGKDRLPTMADQVKLPLTRACVLELQRFANITITNVQRMTLSEVTVRKQLFFNMETAEGPHDSRWYVGQGDIHYIMANDPVFVNPREFRPERYLNEDGVTLKKDLVERTIPFSLGKRACAGEGLARVEIFLGLTAIIQHYRILPRVGQTIDLEPTGSPMILLPKPQGLRLEKVS